MLTDTVAEKIWQALDHAHSILLHLHPTPDGDSIGSALGLSHALRELGKQVTVISGDSTLPEYLLHLPGAKDIRVATFPSVDQTEFDTFVSLDSAGLEQISRVGEVVFAPGLTTIVIDHHSTNPSYGQINWVDPTSPATAQLVAQLLEWKKVPFSWETATCLLVGLFTDTGGYQYPPTSTETFRVAAALAAVAPDYHKALFPIQNTLDAKNLAYQGLALRNIELHPLDEDLQFAMSVVSAEELLQLGVSAEFLDKSQIANQLKSVVGWQVAAGVVEIEPGNVKVSFRTRDPQRYNVGQIAAKLGGGGHPAAAGLTLKMPLAEARELLVKTVTEWQNS